MMASHYAASTTKSFTNPWIQGRGDYSQTVPGEMFELFEWEDRTRVESELGDGILRPCFKNLGYSRNSTWRKEVYVRSGRRIDYILTVPFSKQKILVEVKRPKTAKNAKWIQQASDYASEVKPHLCVCTDGLTWHIWDFKNCVPTENDIEVIQFDSNMTTDQIEQSWCALYNRIGAVPVFERSILGSNPVDGLVKNYYTCNWFEQAQYGSFLARNVMKGGQYLSIATRILDAEEELEAGFGIDIAAQLMTCGNDDIANRARHTTIGGIHTNPGSVSTTAFQSITSANTLQLRRKGSLAFDSELLIPPKDEFGLISYFEYLASLVERRSIGLDFAHMHAKKVMPYGASTTLEDSLTKLRTSRRSNILPAGYVLGHCLNAPPVETVAALRKILLLWETGSELERESAYNVLSIWRAMLRRGSRGVFKSFLTRREVSLLSSLKITI